MSTKKYSDKQLAWLNNKLSKLRGLASPSDEQKLLLALADKQDRTEQEERNLSYLLRLEKAAELFQKSRITVAKIIKSDKEQQRKKRNHTLILRGLLFEKAGVANRSEAELLGLLVAASNWANKDPANWERWEKQGQILLDQKTDNEKLPDEENS